MTDRLDEIRQRLEAATPGPWAWEATGEKVNGWCLGLACDKNGRPYSGRVPDGEFVNEDITRNFGIAEHEAATCNYADPEFIARAPEDIAYLLAEVERLQGELVEYTVCMDCGHLYKDRVCRPDICQDTRGWPDHL